MGRIIKKEKVSEIEKPIYIDDVTTEEIIMDEEEKAIESIYNPEDNFEINYKEEYAKIKNKYDLLENNLNSAYAKIRELEKQLSENEIKERSTDMLISQAVSVFSNTITLAIKNKNN